MKFKVFNLWFVGGISYLTFIWGSASSYVGKVAECSNEPVGWDFPILVVVVVGASFIFGFLSKIETKEEDEK